MTLQSKPKRKKDNLVFADDETDGVGTDSDMDWRDGLVAEQTSVEADRGTSKVEQVDVADA